MIDLAGYELKVGDRIAYQKGGRYPALILGVVEGFTDQKVKVLLHEYPKKATVNPYKIVALKDKE